MRETQIVSNHIPKEISDFYEIHNYRNAAQTLATVCPNEFDELLSALCSFRLTLDDIRKPGGSESDIPKRMSALLRKKGWLETRIKGDLLITKAAGNPPPKKKKMKEIVDEQEDEIEDIENIEELEKRGYRIERITRKNFLDSHKVDYVKHRVAFDLEWNSKDQTFDRDLYAFRTFHEYDLIDAAVLLTRSKDLNIVFEELGQERDANGEVKTNKKGKPKLIKAKYGASTTWMGKLLNRLDAGRNGQCPVLALGITNKLIMDWKANEKTTS